MSSKDYADVVRRALLLLCLLVAACSSAPQATPPSATPQRGAREPAHATSTTGATSTVATATGGTAATTTQPLPPAPLADVLAVDATILVAINKVSASNFSGRPLPGYEANRAFLQPEAALALGRVQSRLAPLGLGLKIYDAYRPVRATEAMVQWAEDNGRTDLVGPYIASRSNHNSGEAVDLTLVSRTSGTELDMGTPYETFTPDANTANASGDALGRRILLVESMEAEGFENYEGEWWHFNYFVAGAQPLDEPIR